MLAPPRSAFGAPPQGGTASGPAEPVPRRPLGQAFGGRGAPGRVLASLLALDGATPVGCVHLIDNDDARRPHLHPWLADLVIWRARRSPRIHRRLAGVLDETQNPGRLFTFSGMRKLLFE